MAFKQNIAALVILAVAAGVPRRGRLAKIRARRRRESRNLSVLLEAWRAVRGGGSAPTARTERQAGDVGSVADPNATDPNATSFGPKRQVREDWMPKGAAEYFTGEAKSLAERQVRDDWMPEGAARFFTGDFTVKPLADAPACPKVYVYDLPEYWDFKIYVQSRRIGKDGYIKLNTHVEEIAWESFSDVDPQYIFGEPCDKGVDLEYGQGMYMMPAIMLWRLYRSKRCPMTTNASEADLFLVPVWPGAHRREEILEKCGRESNERLAEQLHYLDSRTAHRHFFLVGKGHIVPRDKCDAWWKKPEGLLHEAMRFAYSPVYQPEVYVFGGAARKRPKGYGPALFDDDELADALAVDPAREHHGPGADYPHLVSVPYPSSIHASVTTLDKRQPWHRRGTSNTTSPFYRSIHNATLASYVGHFKDDTYAKLRHKIAAECRDARDEDCRLTAPESLFDHNSQFCGTRDSALAATFCLEPSGDSPYRKGLYDVMLAGCIPVVFSAYNTRVSPWFVPEKGIMRLSETEYMAGEWNVLDRLRSVSPRRIAKMQTALHEGAVKMQYALDDVPGDAFETLLSGALDLARRRDAAAADGLAAKPWLRTARLKKEERRPRRRSNMSEALYY